MRPPQLPSASRPAKNAFKHAKRAALARRYVLPALLVLAAVSAAVLPGSHAAPANKLASSNTPPAPPASAAPTAGVPAIAAAPLSPFKPLLLAAPLFQAAPLAVYDTDCMTPKTSFTLGQPMCVKVEGATVGEGGTPRNRLVLANPAGLPVSSVDLTTPSSTVSFALPSTATSGGVDNRGTWIIGVVDLSDATLTHSVAVTVRDLNQSVADLTIFKNQISTAGVVAGSNITYQIYIWNRGPDAATNVQFADNTLPNTTFVSLTQDSGPAFNCTTPPVGSAGVSNCHLGTTASPQTFPKGAAASFTAVYLVSTNVANGADLTDTVGVTSETYDSQTSTNSSTTETSASNPSAPTCTLSCPNNITVEAVQGQSGATVTFDPPTVGGTTCGAVTTAPASGAFFPIGSTVVTSTAASGQSCSFVVTVNPANDTTPPTISCPANITKDETSSAANSAPVTYSVTAADNSGLVNVNCTPLASGAAFPAGTTTVQCTATDAAGNTAECSFDVTVNQVGCDLNANSPAPTPNVASLPTITRACSVTLRTGDDPTATDACGSVISGETASDRTYEVPGTYTVVWTYTDSAGHTATQNQTITILPDNSAPVPDAASLPTVTGECFAAITGDAPTATDNCGGSEIAGVALDPLSYSTVGTHVVRWQFSDAAGNTTIQTQNVVVTDTHAPTVTLTGPSSVTVECHTSYTDAGATASDNCSPAPTPTVTSNNVNIDVPGTYQVVWSATDAGGNTASATRTVVVVDTTKPVITLNGPASLDVLLHSTYVDAGATATDSCAGSVPVTATSTVNTHAIGTYTVTYNATDPSGNAAIPVVRTVRVIYDFTGFFSPVANEPTFNEVKAGQSVPMKFSLSGNQGLNILAANSPVSAQVACPGVPPYNEISEVYTLTAGNSGLSYDSLADQYKYVWKTESSWANTCRQFVLRLNDGTEHRANFKFK